jgi:uncharacterized membrane protein HdeD (DUF308 family)
MTTLEAPPTARPLRTLYLVRFAFALAWAALLAVSTTRVDAAGSIGLLSAALLVLYPLFDLVAAVVDRRSAQGRGATSLLVINMALSLLTGIALVFAAMSGAKAVLIVWGLWAITAGAVQLVVGIRRRAMGGQWAMILSGGLSVPVGVSFVAQAAGLPSSVTSLAGYAVLGGIFFLVSALRLGRVARGAAR